MLFRIIGEFLVWLVALRKKVKKKGFLGLVVVLFVVFFLSRSFWLPLTRKFDLKASSLAYPLLYLEKKAISCCSFFSYFFVSKRFLREEISDYKSKYEKLLSENIKLKNTSIFELDISELDLFRRRYSFNNYVGSGSAVFGGRGDQGRFGSKKGTLIVQILSKSLSSDGHFFLLDAGENLGVKKNMIAVYKNCILGQVSEVYSYYSKLTLMTDRSCKIAAFCNTFRIQGIHEGLCSLDSAKLSYTYSSKSTDIEQDIKKGDMIFSSGKGLIFPRGFGLSEVQSCYRDGLKLTILLKPLLNLSELDYCCLIEKGVEYRAD